MQTVSIKLSDETAMRIDEALPKHNFATRSEFIREAIRDKIAKLEAAKFETDLRSYLNISKKNEELDKRPQEAAYSGHLQKDDPFHELERKFVELREHLN